MHPVQPFTARSDSVQERSVAQFFEMRGRISVRAGDRIDSGQLRWTRTALAEEMGLFSPFGNQVAQVSQAGTGPARMRRGEEIVEAASLNELAVQLLGVPVETERIAGWVQGAGLRDGGEVEVFVGTGEPWRVLAEEYRPAPPFRYAHRVTATRGDVVVKLVIDEWKAL